MHRIHKILDDQKHRHKEHHSKLYWFAIITYIACFVAIVVMIWMMQIAINQLSVAQQGEPVKSEIVRHRPIIMPITIYPTMNPQSCEDDDQSFCDYLFKIQELVATKNFTGLIDEQELQPFTCPQSPVNYYICEGQPVGKVVYGYRKNRNDAEGGLFPKDWIVNKYNGIFNTKNPFTYYGYKKANDGYYIIYLDKDQYSMNTFHVVKGDNKWFIKSSVDGYSFGYKEPEE